MYGRVLAREANFRRQSLRARLKPAHQRGDDNRPVKAYNFHRFALSLRGARRRRSNLYPLLKKTV
jgi:hypothetical protein